MIKLLLQAKTDVHFVTMNETTLYDTSLNDVLELMRLILKENPDVNSQDQAEMTSLAIAAKMEF